MDRLLDSRAQMRWYVNRAGETTGPHEEREVAELIASGVTDADVRDEQGGAWMPLDKSPFRRLLKTAERSESFGYALVAVPAIFGILVFAYGAFAGSSSGTEYVILGAYVAAITITTGLAVVEARQLRMGHRSGDGKKGLSPLAWGTFHVLVWAIAYPAYLSARGKFGRQKLLVWGLISLAIYLAAIVVWVPKAYNLHRQRELLARFAELERKAHCATVGNCPAEKLELAKGLVEDGLASPEQAAEEYCRGTLLLSGNAERAFQQVQECMSDATTTLQIGR